MATPAPRAISSAVRAFARRHGIFRPGPLLVAVSGGTDSVALALILAEVRDEFGLVLHVAHFDHRTRPRSSARDVAFVSEIADRIGAPIRIGRAERAPKSEDDARQARYTFLRRAAMQVGAGAIATGHTRDDQAETVLLHLTRGSGLAGLAAMRPLRAGIARPLLAIGRTETTAICEAARIRPREDPSNASLRFARNRIRLRVLPELERINPRVREALARFAEAAAATDDAITSASEKTRDAAVDTSGAFDESVALDGSGSLDVRALPADALSRARALAEAWRSATGVTLTARQRAALSALAESSAGTRRIDLPGGQALREYSRLSLGVTADASPTEHGITARAATRARSTDAQPHDASVSAVPVTLKRGGAVTWHDWRIALGVANDAAAFSGVITDDEASQVVIRSRRPGDRVRGRGKLQDVFVNAKVPARQRDIWPLVTLNGQEIVWVPGVTDAPRSGSVSIAAGPAAAPATGEATTSRKRVPTTDAALMKSSRDRQVASKSERRPLGGKREPA